MSNGYLSYPIPKNEPTLEYKVGSPERAAIKDALNSLKNTITDIPMYIGGELVFTDTKIPLNPPYEKGHLLGYVNEGNREIVISAIDNALATKSKWEALSWENRAAIFLKAADLIATKYRYLINAATMLGQGKNIYQAELDSACELIDFLRFNVHFLSDIYSQQPISSPGIFNRLEWRPLEGFVLAITPFNFTAIGGNLPISAALCGNVVVWKPAYAQAYSANLIMKILFEAGLPEGVINMIFVDGPVLGDVCFKHKDFAGVHFTGSTKVFQSIWQQIGSNIHLYKSYPRIVGETGGKDFVFVHNSADVAVAATALVRGAFEYQGQKCSAASRAYIPKSISSEIIENILAQLATIKMGSPENLENFVNAVIDERAFKKITCYIDVAKKDAGVKILFGGNYDDSIGYFIEPTILLVSDPRYSTMEEEIFGPVLSMYIYEDIDYKETLKLIDNTSPYALTGAIIARDRLLIDEALAALKYSAGNIYINDKPTGAVVGQQPFGGARGSGTNDKAGSIINLYRWLSPRTVKENFVPPVSYQYPFLEKE